MELLEQPHVLDRYHGLVGERRHQSDLLVSEGTHLIAPNKECTDERALSQHRDAYDRPEARDPLNLSPLILGISEHIEHMKRPLFDIDSADYRPPPWAKLPSLPKLSELQRDAMGRAHAK